MTEITNPVRAWLEDFGSKRSHADNAGRRIRVVKSIMDWRLVKYSQTLPLVKTKDIHTLTTKIVNMIIPTIILIVFAI